MAKNETLGRRLRNIREALHETHGEFAARVGIHRITLLRVEHGITEPGPTVRRKIEQYLSSLKERA